jgi:putative Mg2+ transporter-C (MgtC) family protein
MEAINNLNLQSLQDTLVSLSTAFILGSLIGIERQYRQRTAGLRTNVLVAIGAAAFVDMANRLTGHEGAVHVTAYVISGIGFLGAGVIMKGDAGVRGLNTAATLWGAAAVGACAGADLISEATLVALFVLAGNTLLRPVVNAINRQPIDDEMSEVTYTVCVICNRMAQKLVIENLESLLERADYPIGKVEVRPFAQDEVQIFATLVCTSADSQSLENVVDEVSLASSVSQAFWSTSTTD